MADENLNGTEPIDDPEKAAKGANVPAPIPAHKRPSKANELRKARALLEGKDPETVEKIDEIKDSNELIEVAKHGEQPLRIHPETLQAHIDRGWYVANPEAVGLPASYAFQQNSAAVEEATKRAAAAEEKYDALKAELDAFKAEFLKANAAKPTPAPAVPAPPAPPKAAT